MPELPEVEVTRLGLLPHLPYRKVIHITWSNKSLRHPIPRKALKEYIQGSRFRTIERRAKYLIFRMENKAALVIHLGMTGKLSLLPAGSPREKHDHLYILLDNDMELRLNDSRRFGSITVWPPHEAAELENKFSAGLGVEPLSAGYGVDYLQKICCGRKQPIKTFLMDAAKIAGIGNIYANEILFDAGVLPQTPVSRISRTRWKQIIISTRRILRQAIECGGSSISDFLGASGNPGYFQLRFNVYNRAGQPCRKCGRSISKSVIAGRATYFCPRCQKR